MSAFNLKQHLEKTANLAYEGGRGYFLAQQRAWMNCSKCKREKGKTAQEAWQECFDEFQKGDRTLGWLEQYAHGEGKVPKEAAVDYHDEVVKLSASGMAIGAAVVSVLGKRIAGSHGATVTAQATSLPAGPPPDDKHLVLRYYNMSADQWVYYGGEIGTGTQPRGSDLAGATRLSAEEANAAIEKWRGNGYHYIAVSDNEGDWSKL
jgi:hypothetical protein